MIRLRVPGSLTYRHLALRVVSAACRMAAARDAGEGGDGQDERDGREGGHGDGHVDPHATRHARGGGNPAPGEGRAGTAAGPDGEDDKASAVPESGPTRLAGLAGLAGLPGFEDLGDLGDLADLGAEGLGDDEPLTDDDFEAQTLSAVGEAFNNIAIHAYRAGGPGHVDIEIESEGWGIMIRLMDTGSSFNPRHVVEPDMAALPESGMGLFIMNSFMDEVDYRPGNPNVLRLVKHRDPRGRPADDGGEGARGGAMNPRGSVPAAGAA